jgi:hypothetical protein
MLTWISLFFFDGTFFLSRYHLRKSDDWFHELSWCFFSRTGEVSSSTSPPISLITCKASMATSQTGFYLSNRSFERHPIIDPLKGSTSCSKVAIIEKITSIAAFRVCQSPLYSAISILASSICPLNGLIASSQVITKLTSASNIFACALNYGCLSKSQQL